LGRLVDARAELLVCAQASCPAPVVKECATWLSDLERRLPTVVLSAHDQEERDLSDARVLLDGRAIDRALAGRAHAVDPGSHTFRFVADGMVPVEIKVVLREGEKDRSVDAKMGPAPSTTRSGAKRPLAAFLVGGVGLLAMGAGAAYFLSAKGDVDKLRRDCAPYCAQADVDEARTKVRIADVLGIIGLVTVSVTLWWLVAAAPHSAAATGSRTPQPTMIPSRSGAL
jgi:hypothetical protein